MRHKWKMGGFLHGGDMKCSDLEDNVCAKFESRGRAWKKERKFEVAASVSGAFLDEVIVSGLAMLELQRRTRNNNALADGAGGAAGGIASAAGGGGG